ncbi:MAG: hypothetical protein A3J24_12315 [Deltaproteobacteria bacterium RIFCSPLOWO2_02_FULL_53_8]|nr:MAG: hypothetical protein A3J24_12315 [Deltaproteobacteria bacterium RIFCSPLOWO2_02_FULL_53_8]
MILKGQKIHIKPEWQDAGDDEFTWVALEDEIGGRVKIMPIVPDLTYPPVSVVETRMLIEGDAT